VWKDPSGRNVEVAKIHEIESDFLDRARAAGVPAVLLAPYGTGKTEGGLAYCLRLISEDPTRRLGIVCDKDEHGVDRAQVLLRYIEADEDYRSLFPEIEIDHGQRGRRTLYKFRLKQTKGKDAAVEAAGVFASGTGSRKDIFFFDDVVTKQNAINEPGQRARVKQAFFGTWLSRLEPDNSWWFYIGTTYHADDLTTALRESKDFAVMVIGVAEDFKCYEVEERWPGKEPYTYTIPLWEPKWSEANYRKRYAEMAASGDTLEWMTGYRNMVVDPAQASFKEAWFRRDYGPVSDKPSDYAFRVIFADPATTTKKRSDFYAGWVLGWDPRRNCAVALDGWYKKQGLSDRVKTYLERVEKWAPHRCGIEGRHEISFGERIEEVALDEQMGVRLIKLDREIDKDARIGALAPVLEAGRIVVDGRRFPWVIPEAQLWPNAKHDDALDALEGAWQLIRKWLKRRQRVPMTFDLDGQHARTPGQSHDRFFPAPIRKTPSEELFDLGGM
jgi:phage terminase large subunit-like protein